MHLSLLSEASISRESITVQAPRESIGRAHREGLMRGVLFLAAIAVPVCLAIANGHAQLAAVSAGYAQAFGTQR